MLPLLSLGNYTTIVSSVLYQDSGLQRLKFKMEINVEQFTKVVQKNFILLTTEVEISELLDELYEQSLLCIYDYESLLSKTRIERNYDFFMNIDMYGAAVAKKVMFWLDKRHEPLFFKLSNTQTHEKKKAIDDFESARKGQDCIRKQYVLLFKTTECQCNCATIISRRFSE